MRGMILAAGRGARMQSLTATIPKPLLKVAGRYLIEYPLLALAKIGIQDIVINVSYHQNQIKQALGTGERYGVTLYYSEEEEALETGGGIFQALPYLGSEPFIVLSADVVTDYPLQQLPKNPEGLAHLVLVENPDFHPLGDFSIKENRLYYGGSPTFTFSNIGIYRPELFSGCRPGRFRLGDLLIQAMTQQKVTGELYQGLWHNLGTPEQLAILEKWVAERGIPSSFHI